MENSATTQVFEMDGFLVNFNMEHSAPIIGIILWLVLILTLVFCAFFMVKNIKKYKKAVKQKQLAHLKKPKIIISQAFED